MEFISQLITEYRPLAEFVYFVSSPLLIIGVCATFLQLREFKKDSRTRFKRETIASTMDVLERKLTLISDNYCNAFSDPCYACSPPPLQTTGYSSANNTFDPEWLEWYISDERIEFRNKITDTLNNLESLAQYIYSGLTDEEMCFKLEHSVVIHYINELMPYIAQSREHDDDHLFESIVKLHADWTKKLDYDKTLKAQIKSNQILASNPRPRSEKPIGA